MKYPNLMTFGLLAAFWTCIAAGTHACLAEEAPVAPMEAATAERQDCASLVTAIEVLVNEFGAELESEEDGSASWIMPDGSGLLTQHRGDQLCIVTGFLREGLSL